MSHISILIVYPSLVVWFKTQKIAPNVVSYNLVYFYNIVYMSKMNIPSQSLPSVAMLLQLAPCWSFKSSIYNMLPIPIIYVTLSDTWIPTLCFGSQLDSCIQISYSMSQLQNEFWRIFVKILDTFFCDKVIPRQVGFRCGE